MVTVLMVQPIELSSTSLCDGYGMPPRAGRCASSGYNTEGIPLDLLWECHCSWTYNTT